MPVTQYRRNIVVFVMIVTALLNPSKGRGVNWLHFAVQVYFNPHF